MDALILVWSIIRTKDFKFVQMNFRRLQIAIPKGIHFYIAKTLL